MEGRREREREREREGDMMNGGKEREEGKGDMMNGGERDCSYNTIFFFSLTILGTTSQVHPVEWP